MTANPHHYALAHIALRQICQQDPLAFFGVMGSEQWDDFLRDVWVEVREHCDPEGAPAFDISDVGIATCRIKDFPAIVVTMPPPEACAEAFFVAIVLKIDVNAESLPEDPDFDYFTLEKGESLDGADRTVLCRWTKDGAHANHGDGPRATEEEFIAAVTDHIKD